MNTHPLGAVTLVDTTLRDGMSSVSHQFTPENVAAIAAGLDRAGVKTIEVAHGIGLGASSIQYGFAAATDPEYVRAAVDAVDNADIAALYVPGSQLSQSSARRSTRASRPCGSQCTAPRPTAASNPSSGPKRKA